MHFCNGSCPALAIACNTFNRLLYLLQYPHSQTGLVMHLYPPTKRTRPRDLTTSEETTLNSGNIGNDDAKRAWGGTMSVRVYFFIRKSFKITMGGRGQGKGKVNSGSYIHNR